MLFLGRGDVAKVALKDVVKSLTPYLDVFGEEVRKRGRPAGVALDYETSLEVPSAKAVPDRKLAKQIREKVRRRAVSVLCAVHAEDLKQIYKAELVLELARMDSGDVDRSRVAGAEQSRPDPISVEQARRLPGSGFLPSETYWDWMATFNDKPDDQWAAEKAQVKKSISKLVRGTHNGD